MKRLLASVLLACAAPAPATPPVFYLSGWTTNASGLEIFTIKGGGSGSYVLTFKTYDGTAKAGTDYAAQTTTIFWSKSQTIGTVKVPTFVNQNALGKTLNFGATIALNGVVISSAGAAIVEPPAPVAPTPVVLAPGIAVSIVQACSAKNRPETSVIGDRYTIADLGGDWAVLTNATHPGDGYFSMFLPTVCFAPVSP